MSKAHLKLCPHLLQQFLHVALFSDLTAHKPLQPQCTHCIYINQWSKQVVVELQTQDSFLPSVQLEGKEDGSCIVCYPNTHSIKAVGLVTAPVPEV